MLIARFALAGGLIVATAACGERMIYEASTDPTVACSRDRRSRVGTTTEIAGLPIIRAAGNGR